MGVSPGVRVRGARPVKRQDIHVKRGEISQIETDLDIVVPTERRGVDARIGGVVGQGKNSSDKNSRNSRNARKRLTCKTGSQNREGVRLCERDRNRTWTSQSHRWKLLHGANKYTE